MSKLPSDTAPPLLRLAHISKRFGALLANDDVSLELQRGEVLALLGENGAGKSTLMSILFGHVLPDAGRVEVEGKPLPPGDTRAALAAGIGMVHQHFTLADNLSVLDNVMLGTEPLWQPFSRRQVARERLLATAQRFGLHVDPEARIGDLSMGERQQVEILKALVRGARVLILDEPTAVLTPPQSEALFATLRGLVREGLSILFISHKLDEVRRVSDRVAVLRAGRLVARFDRLDGVDSAALAEAMVGHALAPVQRSVRQPGALVCRLREASVAGQPRPRLDRVTLELHANEVVGIAGVSGNGQQVLAELLCGVRALDSGTLVFEGRRLPARPRAWLAAGVARIPEDHHAVGAIGDLALWENVVLERYAGDSFSLFGWLRRRRAQAHAQALVQRFDVRGTEAGGLGTPARRLSGGNLQKLILGRALAGDPDAPPPKLIVANQPTWGLDVGAVAYVHEQLRQACDQGAALLLISDDLDELFALSDRIAVMHHGRLGAARRTQEWTRAGIGLAMAGAAAAPSPAAASEVMHAA
ncbi:ABC transporter ATP-binding protein [Azohydromonas caseinilytica]|uniref:ABC transporter ATP-binding protein n=1 Tax=Azohydromonas caseinilytica TaxID=2728836 RepID=A0A848FC09_9BURK|nr:ABC transporter ATP-binding protein [Azohydromonas caseinilytica]NML16275.1 ABC transporter ATP-binding protein [Azohydromonas caseinilytica]